MKDKDNNVILCDYGCNKEANYILKNGKYCCCSSCNKCENIRNKNSKGVKKAYQEGRIDAKLIYQNKSEESKKRMNWIKGKVFLSIEDIEKSKYVSGESIHRFIDTGVISNLKYKCQVCGNEGIWLGKTLALELHHINGKHYDNHISNLAFLCPNCHSQTENFRSRNRKCSGKYRVIKKELIEHLNSDFNGDIEKFIDYYKFNNTSKVYREYFNLLRSGLLSIKKN